MRAFLHTRTALIVLACLAIVAFYLLTSQSARVFGALPYLLLLLCPLLHLFGHGAHGGQGEHAGHAGHHASQAQPPDGRE